MLFGDNALGGQNVDIRVEELPLDWGQVFGRKAPLSLEIGFNRGRFLCAMAERYPQQDFVGIEVRQKFCWRLANDLGRDLREPGNIRIIWADAKVVSKVIFGSGVLDNIYITFPDPWWKTRHAKRRLVDTDFAAHLVALLRPGGQIWVKSDVPAIAGEIADSLATVASLTPARAFEESALPLTHREVKCLEQDIPIIRFVAVRKAET